MFDDDDLDFGTFDFDFEDLIDVLDAKELDRLNMDYDYLVDKTFENENKINAPTRCVHEMEKKYLLTSFYLRCKKCGYEEG